MRVAILVHGLYTGFSDKSSLSMLSTGLVEQGFKLLPFNYGKLTLFSANKNKVVASWLIDVVKKLKREKGLDITLIGFSNGCAIIDLALRELPGDYNLDVVYISPLLSSRPILPPCVNKVLVVSNPKDHIVRLLQPLSFLKRFLKSRNWGLAAITGYLGSDPRVTNLIIRSQNDTPFAQHLATLHHPTHRTLLLHYIRTF